VTGFINKGMPFRFPIDRTNQPTELGSWFTVVGAHMSARACLWQRCPSGVGPSASSDALALDSACAHPTAGTILLKCFSRDVVD